MCFASEFVSYLRFFYSFFEDEMIYSESRRVTKGELLMIPYSKSVVKLEVNLRAGKHNIMDFYLYTAPRTESYAKSLLEIAS